MNLRQLEFFRIMAETQHMTQSAEILNTTQPNLSHALKELEKELQAPLFEKKGRNIGLTKYGEFFYHYVVGALDQLAAGERALKEWVSPTCGRIDLGFTYTMGPEVVPKLIADFQQTKDNQEIRFQLKQGNSSDLLDALLEERLDLAICSKMENYPKIHFEPLLMEEIVLIVPKQHPLASKKQLSLKETMAYPYIFFNEDSGLRPYVQQLFHDAGITPKIVYEVEEDNTMAGFVSCNYGIAVIPKIPTLSSYNIQTIAITDKMEPRYIYLATALNRQLAPAVLKFKQFAHQMFDLKA